MSSQYQILTTDKGRVLNIDASLEAIDVILPSPAAGFVVTVKDLYGQAANNNITVYHSVSELIDNLPVDVISVAYTARTYISDGTNWVKMSEFTGSNSTPAYGRTVFAGGNGPSNVMDYVTLPTLSNALAFGSLTVARQEVSGVASSTRGVYGGGSTGSVSTVLDYITIATTTNATSFGSLVAARQGVNACSNATRGLFSGGYNGSSYLSSIDYITIATTANATSFGNMTKIRLDASACGGSTRGLIGGGDSNPSGSSVFETSIEYLTYSTTGNGTTFASLTQGRIDNSSASNATRGLWAGGYTGSDSAVIDYVTIATLANAVSFGNLTSARRGMAGGASPTMAVFGGGTAGSSTLIDYVIIATTSNGTNFGNLTSGNGNIGACSNSHGGL